jgi:hypothetical protein
VLLVAPYLELLLPEMISWWVAANYIKLCDLWLSDQPLTLPFRGFNFSCTKGVLTLSRMANRLLLEHQPLVISWVCQSEARVKDAESKSRLQRTLGALSAWSGCLSCK